jgi:hypothetical protein
MDCVNAMTFNDSREIYILEEFKIKQWADELCIGFDKEDDQKTIISKDCE